MKVQLNICEIAKTGEKIPYAALLIDALNTPVKGGFTPLVMKERINIIDKLENAKNQVELTDDELKVVKALVKAQTFGIIDKALVDYVDYIESL